MQIDKTMLNSLKGTMFKEEMKSEKKEKKENSVSKEDSIELSGYVIDTENTEYIEDISEEKSYIQLKYVGNMIRESSNKAVSMYNSLSNERVAGLL